MMIKQQCFHDTMFHVTNYVNILLVSVVILLKLPFPELANCPCHQYKPFTEFYVGSINTQ